MITGREAELALADLMRAPLVTIEHSMRLLRLTGLWLDTGRGVRNRAIEPYHLINGMLAILGKEPINGPAFVKSVRALKRSSQKKLKELVPSLRDEVLADDLMASFIGQNGSLVFDNAPDFRGNAFDELLPNELGEVLDAFFMIALRAAESGHDLPPNLFSLQIARGESPYARIVVESDGNRREFLYTGVPLLGPLESASILNNDFPEDIASIRFGFIQKLVEIYRRPYSKQNQAAATALEPASSKAETKKRASKRTKAAGPASPTTSHFNQPYAEAARSNIGQLKEGGGGAQRSSVSNLREAASSLKGTDRGPDSSRSNQLPLGGGRLRSRAA